MCCTGMFTPRPGSPEWGKQYKPENNTGCCGHCKKQEEVKKPLIQRVCFLRYDAGGKAKKYPAC
jgi:hypothetical protein